MIRWRPLIALFYSALFNDIKVIFHEFSPDYGYRHLQTNREMNDINTKNNSWSHPFIVFFFVCDVNSCISYFASIWRMLSKSLWWHIVHYEGSSHSGMNYIPAYESQSIHGLFYRTCCRLLLQFSFFQIGFLRDIFLNVLQFLNFPIFLFVYLFDVAYFGYLLSFLFLLYMELFPRNTVSCIHPDNWYLRYYFYS